MLASFGVPKAVAELAHWLADRPEPVPLLELPDRLRDPDVLIVGERRGLLVRVIRYEAVPTQQFGPNLIVGHGAGWQPWTPGFGPDRVHVMLTRDGRAWVAERRLAQGADARAEGYSVARLRELTGLGNTALNQYARKSGVTTPRRGQRNFRYSAGDVRAILETIVANTGEETLLARCRAALKDLQK